MNYRNLYVKKLTQWLNICINDPTITNGDAIDNRMKLTQNICQNNVSMPTTALSITIEGVVYRAAQRLQQKM